jgi:hypothetical protein
VSGTVNTKAFEKTVSSDSQGEFRLEVPVGRYFLSATAQGYTVARVSSLTEVEISDEAFHSIVRIPLHRQIALTGKIIDDATKVVLRTCL